MKKHHSVPDLQPIPDSMGSFSQEVRWPWRCQMKRLWQKMGLFRQCPEESHQWLEGFRSHLMQDPFGPNSFANHFLNYLFLYELQLILAVAISLCNDRNDVDSGG